MTDKKRLNWSEGFRRLRMVLYVLVSVPVLWILWVDKPTLTNAMWDCAATARQHIRSAHENSVDVYPAGMSDEEFCRGLAANRFRYDKAPGANLVAAVELEKAEGRNMLWEQAQHMTKGVGWLLFGIAISEMICGAFIWAFSGLFAGRPSA